MSGPRGEGRALLYLQRKLGGTAAVPGARLLSGAGEHAWVWVAVTATGTLLDRPRRRHWRDAGAAVIGAHAVSIGLKRVVRRPRPVLAGLDVHVTTIGKLSFPSSHAASTTAFAVAMTPIAGPTLLPLAAAMAVSRVLLGVHWPSDVLAGSAVGLAAGRIAVRRSLL